MHLPYTSCFPCMYLARASCSGGGRPRADLSGKDRDRRPADLPAQPELLTAGPRAGGGFRVLAELPAPASPAPAVPRPGGLGESSPQASTPP